jgi:uncharacterized protein (TIGR03083 family)
MCQQTPPGSVVSALASSAMDVIKPIWPGRNHLTMSDLPMTTSDWPAGTSRAASVRPGKLILRTRGACHLDAEHLFDVFAEQRQRFITVLQGFGPDDWAAATRCADWSAHQVVRHLCDANTIGIATSPDDGTLDIAEGFDPRTSPRQWLAASASESPGVTLSRFAATTGGLLALARSRRAQGRRFDVRMPYGPTDWTVRILHAFWDSWIHERDVLFARGAEHPTDSDATAYATAYGIFIAAAVAPMFGGQVQQKLKLASDGGGIFEVDSRDGVTLTVHRVTTAGPPAAEVADALAGRSQTAAVLGGLPAGSRAALLHMADFFRTPLDS